jgi:hypothetical protein
MTDFASDLRERFDWAMYLSLEAYEVLPDGKSFVRSDEDERAIGIFQTLRDSVNGIPPPLIAAAEELCAAAPELFEKTLGQGVQTVGREFFPTSATGFVEVLNRTAQRDMAHLNQPSGRVQ